nr:MAG TPA: protein of unknown function (DUF5485) [Herelleviridae sp.]
MKFLKAFSKNVWEYVLKPLSSLLGLVLMLIFLVLIICPVFILTEYLGITRTFLGQVINWEWLAFISSVLLALGTSSTVNGKIYAPHFIFSLVTMFIIFSILGWTVALSIMYPIVLVVLLIIIVVTTLGLLIYKSVKDVEEDGE